MRQLGKEQHPQADEGHCCYAGCTRSTWEKSRDGHCICHATENSQTEESRNTVWKLARKRLVEHQNCDFSGWHFPEDPEHRYFYETEFPTGPDFSECVFDCAVIFDKARLRDAPELTNAEWRFCGVRFCREANFRKTEFTNARADFTGAKFFNVANFFETEFGASGADLSEASFLNGRADFTDAVFHGTVDFVQADFRCQTLFSGCTFSDTVAFEGCVVRPGVTLVFDKPEGFLRLKTPFAFPEDAATAYRLAKQAAQNRGDYNEAGDFHYHECSSMECWRRQQYGLNPLRLRRFLLCWGEFLFAKGVFGYGERPFRALVAGVVVIVLWSFLGLALDGVEPVRSFELGGTEGTVASCTSSEDKGQQCTLKQSPENWAGWKRLGDCTYFSVVTFTTLGYGDLCPKPHFRGWAAAESVLGAGLMAVFIVGLTRKFMR